jgi:hypothetical protein
MQVLATCFVRKGMDFFFSEQDLKWLDGAAHEKKRKSEEAAVVSKLIPRFQNALFLRNCVTSGLNNIQLDIPWSLVSKIYMITR